MQSPRQQTQGETLVSVLRLLCKRPQVKTIDFRTARFVVGKSCGLNIGDKHYGIGEEVPHGVLESRVLARLYDTPTRRIELLDYALADPQLAPFCEAHGVGREEPSEPAEQKAEGQEPVAPRVSRITMEQIHSLSRRDLAKLCERFGLQSQGNHAQLQRRLLAMVG